MLDGGLEKERQRGKSDSWGYQSNMRLLPGNIACVISRLTIRGRRNSMMFAMLRSAVPLPDQSALFLMIIHSSHRLLAEQEWR